MVFLFENYHELLLHQKNGHVYTTGFRGKIIRKDILIHRLTSQQRQKVKCFENLSLNMINHDAYLHSTCKYALFPTFPYK